MLISLLNIVLYYSVIVQNYSFFNIFLYLFNLSAIQHNINKSDYVNVTILYSILLWLVNCIMPRVSHGVVLCCLSLNFTVSVEKHSLCYYCNLINFDNL